MKKFPPISNQFPHFLHGGDYNPDQWLSYPEILEQDLHLMRVAGINQTTLAVFAWAAIEPQEGVFTFDWLDGVMNQLDKNGIKVILATPSGARPAWLDEKYPQALRTGANRVVNLHGLRHNHCNTSPQFKEKICIINTKLAQRYSHHPSLIMWHISNEYNGECHCDLCQQGFREWLALRYDNDIKKLNHAWWTAFWSHTYDDFDQIVSYAPHGEKSIHGLYIDWMRYNTDKTVEFCRFESEPMRKIAPHIPITTNLMGTHHGTNYWKFAKVLDRISWDNYPKWHNDKEELWETAVHIGFIHDINRCIKGGLPFMMMESTPSLVNWHETNKLKRNDVNLLTSMQAVAHGSDTVQYFQLRKSRGCSEKFHGAVFDHSGRDDTRVIREVRKVGDALKKLDDVIGTSVKPGVAIIFDWENRWAIDEIQALSNQRNYEETCVEHYKAFWKRGIPVDVINMDCNFNGYGIIVAPMLYMLHPGVAGRLKQFVQEGGTLVTTYFTGYVDQNDLCFMGEFPGDGLGEVVGIWAEEIDSIYPSDENAILFNENHPAMKGRWKAHTYCEIVHLKGAVSLAEYRNDFYQNMPAVTLNNYGKGKAYHIATRTNSDMLTMFYNVLICENKVVPVLYKTPPAGVSVTIRQDEEYDYVFIMNFNEIAQTIQLNTDECYFDLLKNVNARGKYTLPPFGIAVLKRNIHFPC